MKRFLAASIALFLGAASVKSQTIPSRATDSVQSGTGNRKMLKLDLRKELNFTDEQSAKWDLITKQSREKLATLNENTSLDKESRKKERGAILKEQESQLQAMLTDTQKTRLKEMRKERKARRKKGK